MGIVVVIPSRGRPARAQAAIAAVREHAALISTTVVLAVDRDDPELEGYLALRWPGDYRAEVHLEVLEPAVTGSLVAATNTVSMRIAGEDSAAVIGNLGDDHLVRTLGFDQLIADKLSSPGIAFGDDLLQGARLPTAPFMSARIVNALGYYFPPTLVHMYPDNALYDIGDRLGILRYLPNVVIEHIHPGAGKAELDEGYLRADASTAADRESYHAWRARDMHDDIARVRLALAAAA